MKEITLEDLKNALEKSWSRETSNDSIRWMPENPAWGQCAITALIIQDFFGGNLIRYDLLGLGSHYFNQLPDGSEIDFTKDQFSKDIDECIKKHAPKETRTREYVLSYPNTVKRYKLLKQRVEKFLEKGEKMRKKKIFLICPVRNITEEQKEKTKQYIEKLERQGHKVHWPPRDTNQDDPIGLRICTDNAQAIIWADEIHIWWDPNSQGSLFDFGMSFICYILGSKKIILANPEDIKPTEKKSFNNVLLTLHAETTEEKQW